MITVAGIDIGTNTLRLLIAEFSPDGRFNKIHSRRHITRLGEDITKTGRLKGEAMDRSIHVLESFSKDCKDYPIDGVYAVATSAVRDSANGRDFISMIKTKAGLDVDIITGDEEARLTMLGVSSGLNLGGEDIFLMDVGGGSTEFINASGASGRDIHFKISTDIGVVRFTEQYIHSDPPSEEEIKSLESVVEERLRLIPPFKSSMDRTSFIGTAGTVTTLAAIEQGMKIYDPERVNGYRLSKESVDKISRMLIPMTIRKRKDVPGIEEGREDIIAAGALIVRKVMERFGFNEVVVSDNGLREGLVIDLYNRMSHALCN